MKKVLKYSLLLGSLAIPVTVIPLTMTSCNASVKEIIDKIKDLPNQLIGSDKPANPDQAKPNPEGQGTQTVPGTDIPSSPETILPKPTEEIAVPSAPTFGQTSASGKGWTVTYDSYNPAESIKSLISKEDYINFAKNISFVENSVAQNTSSSGINMTSKSDVKVEGTNLIVAKTTSVLGVGVTSTTTYSLLPESTGDNAGKYKMEVNAGPMGGTHVKYLTEQEIKSLFILHE